MDDLRLRPMTPAEWGVFRVRAIKEYAQEHVRAGSWSADQAEERAARETDALLPDGPDTPGMLLLVAETADHGAVGLAWVALEREPEGAWLYDIEIVAEQRGRGFGRALLQAVEAEVRERGGGSLGLNVFGGNAAARHLYESSGYEITSMHLRKRL